MKRSKGCTGDESDEVWGKRFSKALEARLRAWSIVAQAGGCVNGFQVGKSQGYSLVAK